MFLLFLVSVGFIEMFNNDVIDMKFKSLNYLLMFSFPVTIAATHVYVSSADISYDVKGCERLKGPPQGTLKQTECMNNEGILEHWQQYIDQAIGDGSNVPRTDEILCRGQRGICSS